MVYTTNLVSPLTSFVGRQAEIARLKHFLLAQDSRTRLLTLVGAGGTGKTRLAMELGFEVLNHYQDGVWLVELANLRDPTLIVQAIANTLNLKEEIGASLLTTLIQELGKRKLLLIMDNCEHLIAEAAHIIQSLVRNCPQLQLLATSREILGIAGEQIFRVPLLSLPPTEKAENFSPQQILDFEAVQLFVERASSASPGFIFSEKNALAILDLCYQLDGIPLALELAAARTRLLSVEQISSRLQDRFRLLTASNRGALPRQQTLYDLVDWSYNLLSQREQVLFRRLAVFNGSFSIEAAEQICAGEYELPGGWGVVETVEVLDLLAELVNKSLVLVEEENSLGISLQNEMRYRMLETIHEFARQKLEEAGEAATIQANHTNWVIALVEEAEPHMRGSAQLKWLNRLELEYSNIRLALKHTTVTNGNKEAEKIAIEKSYRLAGALWPFWLARSHFREGKYWFETLKNGPDLDLQLISRVVKGAAVMEEYTGSNPERARALKEENLVLQRRLNNPRGITEALLELAWFELHIMHYAQALKLSEECLELAYGLDDQYLISSIRLLVVISSLSDFVNSRCSSDDEAVVQPFSKFLKAYEEYGCSTRYEKDLVYLKESLKVWQECDDKSSIGTIYFLLGGLALSRLNYSEAETLFAQSFQTQLELGNKYALFSMAWQLSLLVLIRPTKSIRELKQLALTLAASESLFQKLNLSGFPGFIFFRETVKNELKHYLTLAQFEDVWAEGDKVSFEQFVALSWSFLADTTNAENLNTDAEEAKATPQETRLATSPQLTPIPNGLTERELEVLKLVAQNYTDAEVAQKLILSPRTVNAHLRSIYSKLEVKSRRDATRFAQQNNLF